jgi:hypothetical protein
VYVSLSLSLSVCLLVSRSVMGGGGIAERIIILDVEYLFDNFETEQDSCL